jgi:hypothetical protein
MKATEDSDPLADVLTRFPGSRSRVRELFRVDDEFRELCSDYVECLLTLRRLRRQGVARDDQIEQYVELRLNLEQELAGKISSNPCD